MIRYTRRGTHSALISSARACRCSCVKPLITMWLITLVLVASIAEWIYSMLVPRAEESDAESAPMSRSTLTSFFIAVTVGGLMSPGLLLARLGLWSPATGLAVLFLGILALTAQRLD
jgi:hypothetical protein